MHPTLEKIKGVVASGLLPQMMPSIARGLLNSTLTRAKAEGKISLDLICEAVEEDRNLWDMLDPSFIPQIRPLAMKLRDTSWLNLEWGIAAIRDNHPDIASLFLGDQAAREWFQRQLEEFKENLNLN